MRDLVYNPEAVGDPVDDLSTVFDTARTMAGNAGHPVRVQVYDKEVVIGAKTSLPRAYLAFASQMENPNLDAPTRMLLQRTPYSETYSGALERYVGIAAATQQLDLTAVAAAVDTGKTMQRELGKGRHLSAVWHPCLSEVVGPAYRDYNVPVIQILCQTWKHGRALHETVAPLMGSTFERRP